MCYISFDLTKNVQKKNLGPRGWGCLLNFELLLNSVQQFKLKSSTFTAFTTTYNKC